MAVWLFASPALSLAMPVPVSLAPADLDIERRMDAAFSHAVARLRGRADAVSIRYSASSPIDCIVVVQDAGSAPDFPAALVAELPPASRGDAQVDVSRSPAWSLSSREYTLFFFSRSATGTSIDQVALVPLSLRRFPVSAVRHILSPEPYAPSSYHRLKGYRVLGVPAALLFSSLVTLILLLVLVARKRFRGRRLSACLTIVLLGCLLPSARFSLDLLAMTGRHLSAWYAHQPYEQAGSAYHIAAYLRSSSTAQSPVYLCSDGTSYIPSLFTYALAPRRVITQGSGAQLFIAFEQPVRKGEPLQCAGREWEGAKPLQDFPDGSVVYSLPVR